MVTRGLEGWVNWEIEIDIYISTTVYKIANNNLL